MERRKSSVRYIRNKGIVDKTKLREREGEIFYIPSTFPREIRSNVPNSLGSLLGRLKVPVLRTGNPPLAGVHQLALHSVVASQLLELLVDVLEYEFVDILGLHVGYGTDGEFTDDFSGDDGLRAAGRESAFDTMEG